MLNQGIPGSKAVVFLCFAVLLGIWSAPALSLEEGDWQSIGESVELSISNPVRSRRSADAVVHVDITNIGDTTLRGDIRLLLSELSPTEVSVAGSEQLGGGLAIDFSDAFGNGLAPGESLPRVTLTVINGGRYVFDFSPDLQQLIIPDVVPSVRIASPASLSTVGVSPIMVHGTVEPPQAQLTVNGMSIAHSGGEFESEVSLQEGHNTIYARATLGAEQTIDSISLSLDMTPPYITVESHEPGETVYTDSVTITGLVNDIVRGTIEESQANILVNGVAATISNRSYAARDIPLNPGANTITIDATDQVGNASQITFPLNYQMPAGAQVAIAGGQGQESQISSMLPQPLQVQVVDGNNQGMANEIVVFRVLQGSGAVDAGSADEGRAAAVNTDADGYASTNFRLGERVGTANHKVRAAVVGVQGEAVFYASASGLPGNKISVNSGNNQRGAVGQVLPGPLVVAVTDSGANVVAGARVQFDVTVGGGTFVGSGGSSLEVVTDSDGRATAELILGNLEGLDAQRVSATLLNTGSGQPVNAGFSATAFVPGEPGQTTISGVVLDNQDAPLQGVTVRVDGTTRQTVSNTEGRFIIEQAPVGPVHLIADGSTIPEGEYPALSYNLVTIAGVDNPLSSPIYMVRLDMNNTVLAGLQDVALELPGYPGFKLEIAQDSVTFPDGSRSGFISVTPVNAATVPMAPPNGMQPQFIVTIQPTGTRFDPPARLSLPNVDGHLPGAQVEMYSYDHDLEEFVTIGLGTVSEDSTLITSNSGVGVIKAGWHCGSQPAGSGCANGCAICKECDGNCNCVVNTSQDPGECKKCGNSGVEDDNSEVPTSITDTPGDCNKPGCSGGSAKQLPHNDPPDPSTNPDNACKECDNGNIKSKDDKASCDDGKYCTSADGKNPGSDECRSGKCIGEDLKFPVDVGAQQEYDFSKLRELLNGATLAAKFVPGCTADKTLAIKGAIFMKATQSCCEAEKEIFDATKLGGSITFDLPRVTCRFPAFSWGLATLTANVGVGLSGSVSGSGIKDDCEGTCGWNLSGNAGATISGALAVNVISPDVIEVQGGLRGGGDFSVSGGCGDISVSGCVGPPTVFGKVTLGAWIEKEISTDVFDNMIACF